MKFLAWKANKSNAVVNVESLVKMELPPNGQSIPLTYIATLPNIALDKWYVGKKSQIDSDLEKYGAVLFRGFKMIDGMSFEDFASVAFTTRAMYVQGATPRTELNGGVYTSTEFPRQHEISLHNELSYVRSPPQKIAFCCLKSAEEGGQTQIADVSRVLDKIDKDIVDEFFAKGGWMLRRNFVDGFGPTVFDSFKMSDLEQIKKYCLDEGINLSLVSKSHVATAQVNDIVHSHPVTERKLWFNHVSFWHKSSLSSEVRAKLSEVFEESEFPYSTYYGDGSAIPSDVIEKINLAYKEEEVVFDWRDGDVLLLDNFRIAHGRKPYKGDRSVVVVMGA